MKKLFVVVFMLTASLMFAVAQPGGGGQGGNRQGQGQGQRMTPEERAKQNTDRVATLLSLSNDVKTKIQAVELELNKEMDTKRQNMQGDREAMRELFTEIDKKRDEKYKALLTADQFKKYTDDKASRPQGGFGGGQGGGGGRRN